MSFTCISTAVESSYGPTGPRVVKHFASPVSRVVASECFTARSGAVTRSNEAQREAYQKCILECYYCTTVLGELSDIPARNAGPYIHVGQV
jgi:hypothetical protein